jgi:hypothetical protein
MFGFDVFGAGSEKTTSSAQRIGPKPTAAAYWLYNFIKESQVRRRTDGGDAM